MYFNDVMEGGETVFTHAPGIDHHLVPDTKVPVREVREGYVAIEVVLNVFARRRAALRRGRP